MSPQNPRIQRPVRATGVSRSHDDAVFQRRASNREPLSGFNAKWRETSCNVGLESTRRRAWQSLRQATGDPSIRGGLPPCLWHDCTQHCDPA